MSNKPKFSDYEDKAQYSRDYNNWRYANEPEIRSRVKSNNYNDTYTIYKITNSINDKIYIGSTKLKLNNRLNSHKSDAFGKESKSDFYQFVRSVCSKETFYEVFKIEPIETGIIDKADAWKIEGEYIINAGDKVFNQYTNTGKDTARSKKYKYNDWYTVYEISNIFDDIVYVGVTRKKLNVVLSGHRSDAFNANRKYDFHQFIRSASNHMNFNLVFSIKALQSDIPDLDMASEIKDSILQNYAVNGKPTFNSRFIKKY